MQKYSFISTSSDSETGYGICKAMIVPKAFDFTLFLDTGGTDGI